ncbi:hypothetical protein E2P81_ATG10382 [Venturia nashicola]|nr:hypothetical protein E2P81_ATG10382 [Venturia nashicola]
MPRNDTRSCPAPRVMSIYRTARILLFDASALLRQALSKTCSGSRCCRRLGSSAVRYAVDYNVASAADRPHCCIPPKGWRLSVAPLCVELQHALGWEESTLFVSLQTKPEITISKRQNCELEASSTDSAGIHQMRLKYKVAWQKRAVFSATQRSS